MPSKIKADNAADRSLEALAMGSLPDVQRSSRHNRNVKLEKEKTLLSPRAGRSLKLRDKVNPKDGKRSEKKGAEELVKYMSSLPCYLQRTETGDNVQGKALNFGVLDWGRLEKWKQEQRRAPIGVGSGKSASSGGFSASSSKVSSGSKESTVPAGDRRRRSSLKDHLYLPAEDGQSRIPEQRGIPPRSEQSTSKDCLGIKLEKSVEENSCSEVALKDTWKLPYTGSSISYPKDVLKKKMKDQRCESKRRGAKQLEESSSHPLSFHYSGVDRDSFVPGSDCLEGSLEELEHSTFDYGRLIEGNRLSFTDDCDFQYAALPSDVPYSCPLPCETDSSEWHDIHLSTPDGVEVNDNLPDAFPASNSDEARADNLPDALPASNSDEAQAQSKCKGLEQHKSPAEHAKLSISEPSDGLGLQVKKSNAEFNRLSRSFSSKDVSTAQQLNSTFPSAKIGSASDDSKRNKANACGRSRQSPLRRILDQVLKLNPTDHTNEPTSSSHQSGSAHQPALCDPPALTRRSRRSVSMSDSSTSQLVKRNLDLSSQVQVDEHIPSYSSALLHLAYGDGFPIFRISSSKEGEILAAGMKKVFISEKDDFEWIYTFYSFVEMKKKNAGWINKGRKGLKYVPKILGQMKVSHTRTKLPTKDSKDLILVKEFVLFDAQVREAAHEALDFLPNNELAAIVVSSVNQQHDICDHVSQAKNLHNCLNVECQKLPSVTVIIPNGIHGLPVTGVPSSLIDRWRCGGSCDCGGWDVGCNLTILTGHDRHSLCSSQACVNLDDSHLVDLFVEGGLPGSRKPFSLATLDKGIYSVNFSQSMSLLQAFSICVAILHGPKPANFSQVCNMMEAKTLAEHKLAGDRIKLSTETQEETPASYVPNPPFSPVGRV